MFEVWVRTITTENAAFAIKAALREVEKLGQNGLTQEQFEFTRRFLKGYSRHFAESTYERLGYAIDDRYYGIDGHLARFRAALDALTLEDVNAAIRKHMKVDDLVIAAVTNDAEGLKRALTSGERTPVHYPKDVTQPPAILSEDEEIAGWPLRVQSVEVVPVDAVFAGARP
jgi:zinc protease